MNLCLHTARRVTDRWRCWPAWVRDVFGLTWVLAAVGAVLAPALVHGATIGNPANLDQVDYSTPLATLAWTQVHHGQLPLWNPYSALGMPLAFTWNSAPFSLPSLIGYLFPLHLAYTVQVVMPLVVAGPGVYVLGRVMRLGVLGSVMAAVAYELGGAFIEWVGVTPASVMSWAGWLFAAALLIVRGGHRARDIALFAIVLACAIYAGQPEILLLFILALIVFLAVLLGMRLRGSGPLARPVRDLALATLAGIALGAPLALPGFQIATTSISSVGLHAATRLTASPIELVYALRGPAYLGVITVVLALLAVVFRRRRPDVFAFGVIVVVTSSLTFVRPVGSLLRGLPAVGNVYWVLAVGPMAFAVAVLAGVGMDVLVRTHRHRAMMLWTGSGFALAGAALVALTKDHTQTHRFAWPVLETILGLVLVAAMLIAHKHQRQDGSLKSLQPFRVLMGALLLTCETGFLVFAVPPLWSASPSIYSVSPINVALQRAVGSSVVGFGAPYCFPYPLGILPDINVIYRVHEFSVYEPLTPLAYFRSWKAATGSEAFGKPRTTDIFCPAVTTAVVARRFGVGFVTEARGTPGPQGAVFDEKVGGEDLYRIPGSAAATLTSLGTSGDLPAPDVAGTPVAVSHPDPSTWKLDTNSAASQVLRLHLTDVPGWHGTIDGRQLHLQRFSGVMIEARVPAGRHSIEVSYWPITFSVGIVLAASSGALLCGALVVSVFRRRTSKS